MQKTPDGELMPIPGAVIPIHRSTSSGRSAIHEAGHAVLYIALGLGCTAVTIVPDYDEGSAGTATHGGEFGNPARDFGEQDDDTATLRQVAEEAFWLRHAIAYYAGAEAVRRSGAKDPSAGADDDDSHATDVINRITADDESIDLLFRLAHRRCVMLVEYYRPEIQALAAELLRSQTIDGEEARRIFCDSLRARGAMLMSW